MKPEKTLRTCPKGHHFYKSTDCPTCPVCEELKKPTTGFLSLLSSPARGALLYAGIHTLERLSQHTEKEILQLHGMGEKTMPILRKVLADNSMSFRQK
jgi:DNA-directed RNA polymerase alpha subunit